MPCYHLMTGYRSPSGKITFRKSEAWVDRPVKVPCGNCYGCRLERSRQWAVRCMHEAQMNVDHDGLERNSFITLTYRDEALPLFASLNPKHWQLFAKRLRKNVGPFRYYQCGEYGEEKQRPHHHAIIFGMDFLADRVLHKSSNGHPLYTSKTLNDTWQQGDCYIGQVTYQSAAYVARYCMKKLNGKKGRAAYAIRDQDGKQLVNTDTGEMLSRIPPYSTMSKNPGLGASWLKKFKSDVYPNDAVISNGTPARPPRFYDNQLSEFELTMLKEQRTKTARKHADNNTPERLEVRETCAKARKNLSAREPQNG